MTTSITIRTGGNYVSEGRITHMPTDGGAHKIEEVKVGPNTEAHFGVPHGHNTVVELSEREATAEEAEAGKLSGAAPPATQASTSKPEAEKAGHTGKAHGKHA
jgi:hypothetical protein